MDTQHQGATVLEEWLVCALKHLQENLRIVRPDTVGVNLAQSPGDFGQHCDRG